MLFNRLSGAARSVAVVSILCILSPLAFAQTVDLYVATDAAYVNHYPGADGLIGTADDVVSGNPTTQNASEPNGSGSLGYNAFDFGGASDDVLPPGYNAVTFVRGSMTADLNVLENGGGPILTAMNISSGTEPFPGHGAYTSTITAVNSGTYNPATGDMTLNVDLVYTIFGNTGSESGVLLTGTAIYRDSSEFGTSSGNSYVDTVAVPLAQSQGASSMLYFAIEGALTGYGYPIKGAIVALDVGGTQINQGMSDAWYEDGKAGQGFFIIVWPDINYIFLSWFTFDTERPAMGVTANVGEPGHRWLTAQGPYSGDTATLDIFLTEGGVFDSETPAAVTDQNPVGTMSITWSDCSNADMQYSLPGLGLGGDIALIRVIPSNTALCEAL